MYQFPFCIVSPETTGLLKPSFLVNLSFHLSQLPIWAHPESPATKKRTETSTKDTMPREKVNIFISPYIPGAQTTMIQELFFLL